MKFRYIIFTLDGDLYATNDIAVARAYSEEDTVVDAQEGVMLGTEHLPNTMPISEVTKLPSDTSADDSIG